jgi:hypothetical protein
MYTQAMVMDSFLENLVEKGQLVRDDKGVALTKTQYAELEALMIGLWNAGELQVNKNPDRCHADQVKYLKSAIHDRCRKCQKWTGKKYVPSYRKATVEVVAPVVVSLPPKLVINRASRGILDQVVDQQDRLEAQCIAELDSAELENAS